MAYKSVAKYYDVFDLIFRLGGKGNPRRGLLDVIPNTPLRILDVCVGTAASSMLVASQNPANQILGIDISDEMLAVARQKIVQHRLTNLTLQNMSATAMQFADQSFDGVMISFALHEFDRQMRRNIFAEIARVLKPGGVFCVIDFARQSSAGNRLFLNVWTLIEPQCFVDFLGTQWDVDLKTYGLGFESQREFSFSNLYVLRKA